jgi:hypothetical protein
LPRLLVAVAIVCLAAGRAIADAPFAPQASQPDYVVTMVVNSFGKESDRRTVTHHGGWTRIDLTKTTEYFSTNGIANIRIYGDGRSRSFERGRAQPSYLDNKPRNTGERQTHLGESCTVWDVWRTKRERDGSDSSHLSCVTDDGIELWQKYVSGGNGVVASAEATRVERRPVRPDEVQPPRTLLALDWWDQSQPALAAQAIPDHETVMELSDESTKAVKSIRTTRRLGPWEFLDETVGTRRSLKIMHDSHRMWLNYADDEFYGLPKQLAIVRTTPAPADRPTLTPAQATAMQPKDLDRAEMVLGETCRWFDMMPGMADGGRWACLTNDGIVLKDEIAGRGTRRLSWTAIRLTRRPVSLDEIKPPAELLEPRLWGIDY